MCVSYTLTSVFTPPRSAFLCGAASILGRSLLSLSSSFSIPVTFNQSGLHPRSHVVYVCVDRNMINLCAFAPKIHSVL